MVNRRVTPIKEAFAYAREGEMILIALHGYDYDNDYRGLLTPAHALALAEMLIRSAREISDKKEAP